MSNIHTNKSCFIEKKNAIKINTKWIIKLLFKRKRRCAKYSKPKLTEILSLTERIKYTSVNIWKQVLSMEISIFEADKKITAASSEGRMEQISLFDTMPNDVWKGLSQEKQRLLWSYRKTLCRFNGKKPWNYVFQAFRWHLLEKFRKNV